MTLQEMKNMNPETVARSTLVDIASVEVDSNLPKSEWMKEYLQQIKNPYMFLCNGVVVKIAFTDSNATIEDKLEQYIRQRQKN